MKIRKLVASVLGLLAMVSCGNDIEVLSRQDTPTTKEVMVSLSVEKEISDDFSVTYGIKADDSGIIQAMEMPENDIVLRIGVRRGTGATLVQDIKFTKTKDKNHAWYEGKITVPTDGTGDYQIVAFLKEDANGLKYLNTSKEFTTPQVVGAKEGGLSNIPFLV